MIKKLNEKDFDVFEYIFREFEKEPFFEKWTNQEVYDEFKEFINTGIMFTYDDKGLATFIPNKRKKEGLPYESWRSFIYLSDIVVVGEYRGQGIGSKLMDYSLEYFKSEYDYMYFRTNVVGSMSEGIAVKRGFEVINDNEGNLITDDVEFMRQNGKVEKDKRKYLVKRMK